MPGITHKFVSAKADEADATNVRPSNWNDTHEAVSFELQTDDNVSQGQVVRVINTSRIVLASAQNADGLAMETKAIGLAVKAIAYSEFEMADWTNVIGTALLTPGLKYYLDQSNPGKMTSVAPTAVGEYVLPIGRAVSTIRFRINIQNAILL